ncbi:MAG: hypothetical protein H6936_08465 [Burkholderiales bacterium]|nr:hypothetical protein [Burkholderiales bacterium]
MANIKKIRTPVIFDKIGFTFPIPKKYRLGIKNKLINLLNDQNSIGYVVKWYPRSERYGDVFQIEIPTDTDTVGNGYFTAKILIYPVCKAHNFFKLEFNPAKLGTVGGKKLRRILFKVLGINVVRKLYFEARLTRVDLTIDIRKRIDCLVYMAGARCSSMVCSESGAIGSQIVGGTRSAVRMTLYDKAVEQGTDGDWHRLEIVLRDLGCSMADLDDNLLQHFNKLRFFSPNFFSDDYFDSNFLAVVCTDGLNAALSQLDRNTRIRYLRRLRHHERWPINTDRLTIKPGVESLLFLRSSKYAPKAA